MTLDGSTSLVTGGGSGIGRATSRLLASRGSFVVVADLDSLGGTETLRLIEEAGGSASFEHVDVSRPEELERLFERTLEERGALHVLVNCAGLVSGAPDFPLTSPRRIAAVVAVNVAGTFVATRLAIEAMSRTGGGAVVNISSRLAAATVHPDPVYAATKAAVESFTVLCGPFAATHGVRVNALLPGGVDTPILVKTGDGAPAAWLAARLQEVELLTPEEVATAVLDLVEDETRAGATEVIRKEGGRVAREACSLHTVQSVSSSQ